LGGEREREREREREKTAARVQVITELGGPVFFEFTHDLIGDLFSAKTRALQANGEQLHQGNSPTPNPETLTLNP
jgi:hypothetical protein